MDDPHLTRKLLDEIASGDRPAGDLVPLVLAHLFELCPRCFEEYTSWERGGSAEKVSEADYRSAVQRVIEGIQERTEAVARERGSAAERLESLLAVEEERRREEVERRRDLYSGSELARLLLDKARECLPEEPSRSESLAHLAKEVLSVATPSPVVIETYARAHAFVGNALRARGEVKSAAELLADARFLLKLSGGEAGAARAELDSFDGSLRLYEGKHDDAVRSFSRAIIAFEKLGDRQSVARNLVSLSLAYGVQGDRDKALDVSQRVLDLLDRTEQPHLYLQAVLNVVFCLTRLDAHGEARAVLDEHVDLCSEVASQYTTIRFHWLDGRLAHHEGRLDYAEERLLAIRDSYLTADAHYDAALVSLDLALVYAEQRRVTEIKRLAREIYPVFEAQGVHPRATEALMLFQDAVRAEQVSKRWLHELIVYFESARFAPALPFRQPS